MPNILRNLLKPAIHTYVFPNAEDIPLDQLEEDPPEEIIPEEEILSEEPEQPAEQDGASVIAFAQVQAEQILADAEKQAEELIRQRQRQAEDEIQKAREDAKSEGYRQGYAEGLQQARVESQTAMQQQLEKQARDVAEFLEKASNAREELIRQTQQELCDLSIAVAEKVIHISLKTSSEVIARMIQVVTEKMKRREWVHIYVGGCDAKGLAQITPELTMSLASLSDHIKIIPMTDDESGTCIIEMPDEIIDASVSTQIQNIRDILNES